MNAKQIAERLREQAAYVELLHPLDISPEDVAANYREAADLLERMAWVPVSERLPFGGQRVIARYAGVYENRPVTYWIDSIGRGHFGSVNEPDGRGSQPATHWMPLPDPPSE